ncbi:hypothetical protein VTK26DRAFT_5247 [Humicola hyalothermophila]
MRSKSKDRDDGMRYHHDEQPYVEVQRSDKAKASRPRRPYKRRQSGNDVMYPDDIEEFSEELSEDEPTVQQAVPTVGRTGKVFGPEPETHRYGGPKDGKSFPSQSWNPRQDRDAETNGAGHEDTQLRPEQARRRDHPPSSSARCHLPAAPSPPPAPFFPLKRPERFSQGHFDDGLAREARSRRRSASRATRPQFSASQPFGPRGHRDDDGEYRRSWGQEEEEWAKGRCRPRSMSRYRAYEQYVPHDGYRDHQGDSGYYDPEARGRDKPRGRPSYRSASRPRATRSPSPWYVSEGWHDQRHEGRDCGYEEETRGRRIHRGEGRGPASPRFVRLHGRGEMSRSRHRSESRHRATPEYYGRVRDMEQTILQEIHRPCPAQPAFFSPPAGPFPPVPQPVPQPFPSEPQYGHAGQPWMHRAHVSRSTYPPQPPLGPPHQWQLPSHNVGRFPGGGHSRRY